MHVSIQDDYLESTLATILKIHDSASHNGDILVFFPGQEEIENMVVVLKHQFLKLSRDCIMAQMSDQKIVLTGDRVEVIHSNPNNNRNIHEDVIVAGVMICVLFAALPLEAQLNAFRANPQGVDKR